MTPRVVIIGGGVGGASAALRLARRGSEVILLERGDRLGGLVTSFEVAGVPLERAYHYLIPGEQEILDLIEELGLSDRVQWFPSTMANFVGGRVWPFTTPLDLLRFRPLPPTHRIRTGVGALRFAREKDWESLDDVPAIDWLRRLTSDRAAEVVWAPLLRAKFGPAALGVPAAWMWSRMRQRAGGRKRGREYLGYMMGGFRLMFEELDRRLREAGAEVRTGTAVRRIALEGDRVRGVELDSEEIEADDVLFTGPLPQLPRLLPADAHDPRWSTIGGLGVMCVILEMSRPITDVFWVNMCDPHIPFGGIIEHTNLIPPSVYKGRHIAYLSRYFVKDEPIATADPNVTAGEWVTALEGSLPGFRRESLLGVHAFRADYAAPLVTLGYRDRIPPMRSHITGLYLSTTAQIYPRDRGMSEGVRMSALAVKEISADIGTVRDAI